MSNAKITLLNTTPIPKLFYTAKAWNTIQYLVHAVTTEIGWWQMAEKMSDGNYIVTETIVPEQTVSGGEADISRDALAEAGDALMAAGHDISKLLMWGHSHVNMGTTPSGQDVSQALAYSKDVPYLIRGIYNKKGEARVDILDFELGLQFNDVINEVYTPSLTAEQKAELDILIEANVKTRSYQNYGGVHTGAGNFQRSNYGSGHANNGASNQRRDAWSPSGKGPNGSAGGLRRAGIDGYWKDSVWVPYTFDDEGFIKIETDNKQLPLAIPDTSLGDDEFYTNLHFGGYVDWENN